MSHSTKKLTQEEVINRIKTVHGNLYDLSLIEYKNRNSKVKVICKIHGEWQTTTEQLYRGQGCFTCGKQKAGKKRRIKFSDFVNKANKIHNNKYDYNIKSFKKIGSLVEITCPEHGTFSQFGSAHIDQRQGCPDCGFISQVDKRRMSKIEFLEKANEIHSSLYNYRLVKFKNQNSLVDIICSKHGVFKQNLGNHLTGSGCPDCNNSKGENKIKRILIKNKIEFIQQKSFKGLKDRGLLKCDFYLIEKNIVIEFNGRQHFELVKAFGGKEGFKMTQKRDQIKRDFLYMKKIPLLEIHYKNKNIELTILDFIKKPQHQLKIS